MEQEKLTPSQNITNQIAGLTDWRGELLNQLRALVLEAAPEINEEWKWDTAVWAQNGLVCSAGVFKDHVKLNFFKGASLADPEGVFNAGLEAKASRSIDFYQGDEIDVPAVQTLVRAAVAFNHNSVKKK